ncbi:MAG: hypothetical protein FD130_593 [Halothiobacillaceae bacterium]|nr:MAG: hypothetical protein FD130_593 [Halothiobacillaceae bacterium]
MQRLGKKIIPLLGVALMPGYTLANDTTEWSKRISISGSIEAEVTSGTDYTRVKQSDVRLATVELAIDAAVNERVTGHLLLLHEEGGASTEVDEGTITMNLNAAGSLYLVAGRMYLPFGRYETGLLSDPLALEIGETRDSALQLGFDNSAFRGSLFLFNGATIENSAAVQGAERNNHYGFNIGYTHKSDAVSVDVGVGYVNSIGDSLGLTEKITPNANGDPELSAYVSGQVWHGSIEKGDFLGIIEILGADEFQAGELAFNGEGASPEASNIELDYHFKLYGKASTLAIAHQTTAESLALALPEKRRLVGLSVEIYDATIVGVEYSRDVDYSIDDGGSGKEASMVTLQLAVAF